MPRQRLLPTVAAPLLFLAAVSCRFQDLTPGASRHDDANVLSQVTTLYTALGAKNLLLVQKIALPSATVLISMDKGQPVLVPIRTMIDVPERRNQGGGARVLRTELRVDGDVGTDRVVVVSRSSTGGKEFEATDVMTLARREGAWRVAHAVFGPWHARTAP